MALMEEDSQAQASEPLITDVQRVEVVAPAALAEGYGLDITTTGPYGEPVSASVIVVRGVG